MRFSKIAVALLVCVALAFSTGCTALQGTPKSISGVQIPENPNFRNTVWGMDRADVVKVERLKDSRGYGNLLGNKVQISSDKQAVENQRFEIQNFARANNLTIDGWIEETISGTKTTTNASLANS